MPFLDKSFDQVQDRLTSPSQGFSETDSSFKFVSWQQLFFELFPEIDEGFQKLKLKEHFAIWLVELEKFLRKMRLFFLKIDRLSEVLIKKIRIIHLNHRTEDQAPISDGLVASTRGMSQSAVMARHKEEQVSAELFKKEEQRLILEIAKNPKDSMLYEALGDLYLKINNLEDAKESFEAAIELAPQNESLKQKLSLILEKLSYQN